MSSFEQLRDPRDSELLASDVLDRRTELKGFALYFKHASHPLFKDTFD